MEQQKPYSAVALVVGVTGMAGLSIAEALKSPTALGGPWKVYGSALRPKPTWFPNSIVDDYITFDATRVDSTRRRLSAVAGEVTHVFWVAIQVRDTEEANVEINSAMLENVINTLKSDPGSPLVHVTLQTGTKHYMGPIFDPVHSTRLGRPETPFCEDSTRLPYPNFYYALEDLLESHAPSLSYSVHRSSVIFGASSRSVYNTPLTLSVYAAICCHVALPFRFPGTRYAWEHFFDVSDSRVLAQQHIWASVTAQCKSQAFNCTNGDVFTWRRMWKEFCDVLGMEFVEFDQNDGFDFVELMKDKGCVWDEIVEKYGLYKTKLEEITCFGALNSVLHFEFQHVSSMNKSKEFGFFGYANSLKSVGFWVGKLKEMKIIP